MSIICGPVRPANTRISTEIMSKNLPDHCVTFPRQQAATPRGYEFREHKFVSVFLVGYAFLTK
jgi:hypothetical protein